MDSNKNALIKTTATASVQQTLRRPVQIVKKHSGPLDEVLAELNKTEAATTSADLNTTLPLNDNQLKVGNVVRQSPTPTRRRSTLKDKDKKRERWLLTRKTWRYMTDAGRKLIPDGIQNRQEDIPKIEAHFQKVCSLEPHFVLWRRKYSYPGAMRNSRRRLKQLLQHTGQKSQLVLEQEEVNNADIVLELLHSHLRLDEAIKTDTLLGTKTEGPHQTNSPSAQRPKPLARAVKNRDSMSISLRGPGFLPSPAIAPLQQQSESDQLLQRLLKLTRSTTLPDTVSISPEQINAELLNDKIALKKIYNALKKQQLHRILSKHSMPSKVGTNLKRSTSMLSLFNFDSSRTSTERNKTVTNKYEYSKTKSPLDTAATTSSTITSTILSSIPSPAHSSFGSTTVQQATAVSPSQPAIPQRQRKPPTSLNLSGYSNTSSTNRKSVGKHQRQAVPEKHFNSCGTQTNFIPLSEIKRLTAEYKEYKRAELATDGAGNATTDEECDRQTASHANRRKSSIDNEDVSQSVSDTIKRYLRMARKKSVHDDNANRFKRVNYDRNLRNIQAKGEINPPGMDENNNKAVQTLDAWALITLEFIRGDVSSGALEIAHNDWQKALDERLRRKLEYEQKICQPLTGVNQSTSSCSSSAPTSPISNQSPTITNATSVSSPSSTYDNRPTIDALNVDGNSNTVSHTSGIFHSSSQFIVNLWHANTTPSNLSSPTSLTTTTISEPNQQKHEQLSLTSLSDEIDASLNRLDMKKSKSLSHIGHYVSTKLLRGQLANQSKLTELLPINPSSTAAAPKWFKSGKCSWKSETGEYILLRDTSFHALTELEAKMVKEISIERIIELDIGIDLNDLIEGKSQKKHPLTKMRAMTTSFFDIGKKDSNNQNLSLFGNSLEGCVIVDKKLEVSNLRSLSERGSRNSIASLFRSGSRSGRNIKNATSPAQLNETVRSCENLLTKSEAQIDNANAANSTDPTFAGNYFKDMSHYKSISRSQSDVRRYSHDNSDDGSLVLDNGADVQILKELKVPKFVKCCIHFLEENGLHKVGIFRVSTSKKKVKQLRDCIDKNNERNFNEDTCPHNVATLLKEFLRDLPEPLLSNRLYKAFLTTQRIRNRRLQLEALSHLVKLLPPAHLDTLYVLLKFLAKVAASSDDICDKDGAVQLTGNKMDSNNLATVFAPNILRSTINSKSGDHAQSSREQKSMDDAINVIRIMIDHYEELFLVPADILDIVFAHLLDEAPEQLNVICEYHKTTMENFIQFY